MLLLPPVLLYADISSGSYMKPISLYSLRVTGASVCGYCVEGDASEVLLHRTRDGRVSISNAPALRRREQTSAYVSIRQLSAMRLL